MTQATTTPRPVHLVGSLSLASASDSFGKASALAGAGLRRLPDGETGARSAWIGWQAGKLMRQPFLAPESDGGLKKEYSPKTRLVVRDGTDPSAIRFENLGYADAAIESYAIYAGMKQQGRIGAATRFQVSLPTPVAIVTAFIAKSAQADVEPAMETGFQIELNRILAAIPHDQLALQWDVAVEYGILETGMPFHVEDKKAGILDRLVRLGNAVPQDVELGYHMCYGNMGLKHFKEPTDTGLIVEISNALMQRLDRHVDWIHLPVPIDRDDDAYFAPLAKLEKPAGTGIFLGLLHLDDGLEGAKRRMEVATRHIQHFGIGCECGMSNRPDGWTEQMLALHRDAAAS